MNRVRCAIYTRKSSEEGLEQDFNSLDAQREACAAYVLSQASEGWQLIPEHYDDGGVSGGTLERPALQRLLADIKAGKLDIVVVYKVDRLSRSLFDFAKLVEAFEQAGVSFVSVTQSFNTTTSMGRLTLNMLLSFAQFEREVTAERIRDKIAASKAKGMWMGGTPPLGYRPDGRSLTVIEEHAAIVRDIYARYLKLGSVRRLAEALRAERIIAPRRTYGSGRSFGGVPFTRGQLYFILKNATYIGEIVHKDRTFPGQHAAIIERAQWDQVQTMLAGHVRGARQGYLPTSSLLAGKIVDAAGEPLVAAHTSKGNAGTQGKVRYRYYASKPQQPGSNAPATRLPAREIEQAVREQVAALFTDPIGLMTRLGCEISPALLPAIGERCADTAAALRSRSGGPLRDMVTRVHAGTGTLAVELDAAKVASAVGLAAPERAVLSIEAPCRLARAGRGLKLIRDNGLPATSEIDPLLVSLIARAHEWWALLAQGTMDTTQLAASLGVTRSYLTRVVRLAFLSPRITEAILDGRQQRGLDAGTLRDWADMPWLWREQELRCVGAEVKRARAH